LIYQLTRLTLVYIHLLMVWGNVFGPPFQDASFRILPGQKGNHFMQVARKTKQIIAFAMAFAMLYAPVAQAAGHCNGSCHTAGRYEAVGEAGVTRPHSHAIHSHSLYALSLLDPIPRPPSRAPVDWIAGCKAGIGPATCTMASFLSLVALQGSNPQVTRGHHLLTVSASFTPLEMEPAQHVNCRFEAAHTAIASVAPPPLFLKNLSLLI
jgi:hypothetical protein